MSRRQGGRRPRRTTTALGALACAAAVLLATPGTAAAHPLGNFTVNRYTGLVVLPDAVTVDRVLDLAEIPTAQRMAQLDRNGDGTASEPELAAHASVVCRAAAPALRLTVGGRTAALAVSGASARTEAGQAGLPILRVECSLRADLPRLSAVTDVVLVDETADEEIGWREMTAVGDGMILIRSDVPARSTSRRLTAYPQDLLSSPLDVRSARLQVQPGGARLQPDQAGTAAAAPGGGGDRATAAFQRLIEGYDGSPLVTVLGLLLAILLGAGHALAPGHGKTVMAFYLGGRRSGALGAALTVGATVTVTHTAGVLALGVLVGAGTAFVPARVYPWLTLASGLVIAAVGLTLVREARHGHRHGHPHDHPHPHEAPVLVSAGVHPSAGTLDIGSSHGRADLVDHHHHERAPSRRGLVAMGLAGGLLPSPSALLVFLGALAVGHPWFGVLLVAAFGVGMAATLTAVGIAVMRLRERVERRLATRGRSLLQPAVRVLPLLTACAVVALGTALALRGLAGVTG